eukprot:scpid25701/ scgid13763/ Latrophilin-3; Calcium-independent alpha-latrotoxin receptor 3; Lectomedin-3
MMLHVSYWVAAALLLLSFGHAWEDAKLRCTEDYQTICQARDHHVCAESSQLDCFQLNHTCFKNTNMSSEIMTADCPVPFGTLAATSCISSCNSTYTLTMNDSHTYRMEDSNCSYLLESSQCFQKVGSAGLCSPAYSECRRLLVATNQSSCADDVIKKSCYNCKQGPEDVQLPEGCRWWLWKYRQCLILANATCLTLNRTSIRVAALGVHSSCPRYHRRHLMRASCLHRCGQPILNPYCVQPGKTAGDCVARLALAEMPLIYRRGDCRCRQRPRRRPPPPPRSCRGNSKDSFKRTIDGVEPIEDIADISHQTNLITKAATELRHMRFKDGTELNCSLIHLQDSVKRTFGNRCRWQGRAVVNDDEKRMVKNLTNSYASMVSSVVTQLGCMKKRRRWCREYVDTGNTQESSQADPGDGRQVAMVLDSCEDILDSIPPVENSLLVVSTPQLAMSVVCPPVSNLGFSLDALAGGDEEEIEMSVTGAQTTRQDRTSLLSINMPVIAGNEDSLGSTGTAAGECLVLPMQFTVFKYPDLFTGVGESDSKYKVVTPVVSAAFADIESDDLNFTATSVKIVFNIQDQNVDSSNVVCAYWNVTESEWLTNGCWSSEVNSTHVSCECNHLTSFAVLMIPDHRSHSEILTIISYALCSVALVCFVITIIVLSAFKKLRKKKFQLLILQISVPSFVTTLLVMFTHKTSNAVACKAVAVLLHFSVLCMFSMMAVACSELHRAIVHVFDRTKKRRLRKYAWLIAAGASAVIVITVASSTEMDAYGSKTVCWFNRNGTMRYNSVFYGTFVTPLALMLIHNAIICYTVLSRITKHSQRESHRQKMQQIKNLIGAITTISTVMGLSWILAFLLLVSQHLITQIVFVVVESLQGVAILLLFIFRSPQVRKTFKIWRTRRQSASLTFQGISMQSKPSVSTTARRLSLSSLSSSSTARSSFSS